MNYAIVVPESFLKELDKLDSKIVSQFKKKLPQFLENPRHKSFRSHQVGKTPHGEGIWSSSINMSFRFTWHYGPSVKEITLRHIGTHKIYNSP